MKEQSEKKSPELLSIDELKNQLEECQKERDEYLAGWQRAKADFANYKKEEAKRQEWISKFAAEEVLKDVLLVLDSFDLAITNQGTENSETKRLRIIKEQLLSIVKKWGLQQMDVTEGEKFNPHFHEAVETSSEGGEEGRIVQVLERGYLLHGRVLRPAKVKVAIKPISGSSADPR